MKIFSHSSAYSCLLILSLSFFSCKKETLSPEPEPSPTPTPTPSYTVPLTYDFGSTTNFNSSAQRIAMLRELVTYIRTTHTSTANVSLDVNKLKNMYVNSSSPFTDAGALGLNSSGINLKEKTSIEFNFQTEMDAILTEVAAVSQTTLSGNDGQAGKVLGPVPTGTAVQSAYLMNAKGFEYKELAEKGAMGAILYAEGCKLLKNISNYDNVTVVAGQGTAMEHAWDEAFGYFGVPVSFPTTTTGLSYWGSYCNSVNTAIGSNTLIMNAWLKGRAAISNKDNSGRDAARDVVVNTWEKVGAARLITYLKQAKTNFAIDGARNHALSEGFGFIKAFRYNTSKIISDSDITLILSYIGDNLYQVSSANLDLAINKVATIYNLDASKL